MTQAAERAAIAITLEFHLTSSQVTSMAKIIDRQFERLVKASEAIDRAKTFKLPGSPEMWYCAECRAYSNTSQLAHREPCLSGELRAALREVKGGQ